MFNSKQKKKISQLRKIGHHLQKLCKTSPMDGATADEIIKIIREHQFDSEVINAHYPGQMPPIMCAYWDWSDLNRAIVEEFLKTKCVDVSCIYSKNKRTLLHVAASRGHDKIGLALFERNVIDI